MKKPVDDILLLNLIKEGNELAFRHLFETYFTPLCRFVHVYISEKSIVEELVLDLFLYVWENRDSLKITLSFKAYLFQSARNRSLNFLRVKKRTVSLTDFDCDVAEAETMSLENEDLYRLIQEAVLALPDKCREVFILSRHDSLSNKEIAEKLNVSVKTVESQMTKALQRIKDFLGDTYYYLF